jgi:sugar lactone lactonase YvrE
MIFKLEDSYSVGTFLGEGLYIDDMNVYFLDILKCKLLVFNKQKIITKTYLLPEQASNIFKVLHNKVVLASESGVCSFDLKTEEWIIQTSSLSFERNIDFRANDGCDLGNESFLFGTMEKENTGRKGSLFLVKDKTVTNIYNDISIPNSFIEMPDGKVLISDSFTKKIFEFEFNYLKRTVVSKRVWLDLSNKDFTPDGGCLDSQGNIYIAMWGGACIHQYNSEAKLINSYPIPVLNPTNCKLSNNEKYLYVTSAKEGMSKQELNEYSLSGSLLRLRKIQE